MRNGPSFTMRRYSRRHSGLTLIELLVVMSITGILLTIAVPSFTRQIAEGQRGNAVSALTKSFSLARSTAIRTSRAARMCISTDQSTCATAPGGDWSKGWIVYSDVNGDGSYSTADETLLTQLPLQGLTSALSTNTNNSFAFMPNGLLSGSEDTITIKSKNSDTSDQKIEINRLGRLRLAS